MVRPNISKPLPSSVKFAAGLFLAYGVAVVLNTTAIQGASSWVGAGDFPRALIRLFATGLIAWGLLRRARWAWWIGLAFAAFWLVADALALLVIEHGDVYWLRPGGFQILLVVSLLCLGLAVALLLSPSARAEFRRPAA
ncbi:MAG TPA: hypothetical protein VIQ27_06000 [Gemmatimonadales bacterium]|jgi:hypothetical protein